MPPSQRLLLYRFRAPNHGSDVVELELALQSRLASGGRYGYSELAVRSQSPADEPSHPGKSLDLSVRTRYHPTGLLGENH